MSSPDYSPRQNALRAELQRRMRAAQSGTRRWIPHSPTAKQRLFLDCGATEAFYGGAAGGGKSDALLMAALAFVDVPGYAAILLRRTFADLALPERSWIGPTTGSGQRRRSGIKEGMPGASPSGASLSFGYLETERDKYRSRARSSSSSASMSSPSSPNRPTSTSSAGCAAGSLTDSAAHASRLQPRRSRP